MASRLLRTSPLAVTHLEDRLTPAPLYVIIHGRNSEADIPNWTYDMATAINTRMGLGATQDQITHSRVQRTAGTGLPDGGSPNFLIFDWTDLSTSLGTANENNVAGLLTDMIRARLPASGTQDLHIIGHSRGALVGIDVARRLDTEADNAKIGRFQLTTLDPQSYGQDDDTLLSTTFAISDNVDWAENYYQTDSVVGNEQTSVQPGQGINVDLTETVKAWDGRQKGANQNVPSHSEVRDWYFWTIDNDDRDAASLKYRDQDLNRQQDVFVSNPAAGRELLYRQTFDLDNNGTRDDNKLGTNIGFYYSLGQVFGPRELTGFTSLDLVFVIDTTGSMSDDISNVQDAARKIVEQVKASVPDAQISVITYRDFPDGTHGERSDYQARTEVAFTRDLDSIVNAINGITVGGGADLPESVFSGLARAIDSPWRGGSVRKAIILMGDADAQDPEPGTGLTKEQIILRAFLADPVDMFTVQVNSDKPTEKLFKGLSEFSGGKFFRADGASDVVPEISAAITDITRGIKVGGKIPAPLLVGGALDGSAVLFTPSGGKYGTGATSVLIPGTANVRVAIADVNGDGIADKVAGSGPGATSRLIVKDGNTDATIADFLVFEESFTGGVFVAAADIDGDGKTDLFVTPDQGGGPVVAVYSGAKLAAGLKGDAAQITRFYGIADDNFRGGARVAVGDVNGDGTPDLIVAAGFQGGPRIAIFNGKDVAAGSTTPTRLVGDFYAFEETLRNGAYVAAGDLDGDGKADLFFGGGPNGSPRVRAINGAKLLAAPPSTLDDAAASDLQMANFFAGNESLRGGVSLTVRDVDDDGKADLVTASGQGEGAKVRVYKRSTLLAGASPTPTPDQELDVFGGAALANGVYVG